MGSHILTSEQNLLPQGKPQIGVCHGFLNKEDGRNTYLFSQIQTDDNCIVLLGHDHVPYEPVVYKNTTIFRIGAFVRGIRNDSELRIPQMLRIGVKDNGTFVTKTYDIECKHFSLIFKEKTVKKDKSNDYQSITDQIKMSANKEMTLIEAVRAVSTEVTAVYIGEVLNNLKTNKENKK